MSELTTISAIICGYNGVPMSEAIPSNLQRIDKKKSEIFEYNKFVLTLFV